jgi:hypothetical protein
LKRGIPKQVSIQRTVVYDFTRTILLERLKLPADAILEVDGEALDDDTLTLKVRVQENVQARAAKAVADEAA